ncbi:unnamed protein product [Adineta ricciae]|uniref:Uncharacterized protein n=1 Tax=Adineta ricciae TaxID=249248 RepID=A0A814EQR0_ADIRI|nr:unnamed protein product [Adineta ricciae]
MAKQAEVLAKIEANLHRAIQRQDLATQTVKFELDGQVRACCLPKSFTYSDLLKSIEDLYGNRTLLELYNIHCLFSRDDALRLPITNDEDLKNLFAIAKVNGLNKLTFFLKKETTKTNSSSKMPTNLNDDSGTVSDDGHNRDAESPPPGTLVPQKRHPKLNLSHKSTASHDGGVYTPELIDDIFSNGSSSVNSRESSGNSEQDCKCRLRTMSNNKRTSTSSSVSGSSYSSQTNSNDSNRTPYSRSANTDRIPQTPSNWKLGRQLGQGAFGKVFLCYDVDNGCELAIKQIPIRGINSDTTREVKFLEGEINIYRQLDHERIVRYYGVEQTEDYLQIFMEYMAGGSVREQILNYGALTEQLTKKYTKQILNGLAYLHENRYIHRDIKCANILRDISGNVKLGDFGTSKRLIAITNNNQANSGTIGTAHWTAPEIIQGNIFGRKADIWSLGCTIVEMLTTGPPWQHLQPIAAIFHIVTSDKPEYELPKNVSKLAREFIQSCLTKDYQRRPTATDLSIHPFVCD